MVAQEKPLAGRQQEETQGNRGKVSKTWKEAMLTCILEQFQDKVKVHLAKPASKAKVAARAVNL